MSQGPAAAKFNALAGDVLSIVHNSIMACASVADSHPDLIPDHIWGRLSFLASASFPEESDFVEDPYMYLTRLVHQCDLIRRCPAMESTGSSKHPFIRLWSADPTRFQPLVASNAPFARTCPPAQLQVPSPVAASAMPDPAPALMLATAVCLEESDGDCSAFLVHPDGRFHHRRWCLNARLGLHEGLNLSGESLYRPLRLPHEVPGQRLQPQGRRRPLAVKAVAASYVVDPHTQDVQTRLVCGCGDGLVRTFQTWDTSVRCVGAMDINGDGDGVRHITTLVCPQLLDVAQLPTATTRAPHGRASRVPFVAGSRDGSVVAGECGVFPVSGPGAGAGVGGAPPASRFVVVHRHTAPTTPGRAVRALALLPASPHGMGIAGSVVASGADDGSISVSVVDLNASESSPDLAHRHICDLLGHSRAVVALGLVAVTTSPRSSSGTSLGVAGTDCGDAHCADVVLASVSADWTLRVWRVGPRPSYWSVIRDPELADVVSLACMVEDGPGGATLRVTCACRCGQARIYRVDLAGAAGGGAPGDGTKACMVRSLVGEQSPSESLVPPSTGFNVAAAHCVGVPAVGRRGLLGDLVSVTVCFSQEGALIVRADGMRPIALRRDVTDLLGTLRSSVVVSSGAQTDTTALAPPCAATSAVTVSDDGRVFVAAQPLPSFVATMRGPITVAQENQRDRAPNRSSGGGDLGSLRDALAMEAFRGEAKQHGAQMMDSQGIVLVPHALALVDVDGGATGVREDPMPREVVHVTGTQRLDFLVQAAAVEPSPSSPSLSPSPSPSSSSELRPFVVESPVALRSRLGPSPVAACFGPFLSCVDVCARRRMTQLLYEGSGPGLERCVYAATCSFDGDLCLRGRLTEVAVPGDEHDAKCEGGEEYHDDTDEADSAFEVNEGFTLPLISLEPSASCVAIDAIGGDLGRTFDGGEDEDDTSSAMADDADALDMHLVAVSCGSSEGLVYSCLALVGFDRTDDESDGVDEDARMVSGGLGGEDQDQGFAALCVHRMFNDEHHTQVSATACRFRPSTGKGGGRRALTRSERRRETARLACSVAVVSGAVDGAVRVWYMSVPSDVVVPMDDAETCTPDDAKEVCGSIGLSCPGLDHPVTAIDCVWIPRSANGGHSLLVGSGHADGSFVLWDANDFTRPLFRSSPHGSRVGSVHACLVRRLEESPHPSVDVSMEDADTDTATDDSLPSVAPATKPSIEFLVVTGSTDGTVCVTYVWLEETCTGGGSLAVLGSETAHYGFESPVSAVRCSGGAPWALYVVLGSGERVELSMRFGERRGSDSTAEEGFPMGASLAVAPELAGSEE